MQKGLEELNAQHKTQFLNLCDATKVAPLMHGQKDHRTKNSKKKRKNQKTRLDMPKIRKAASGCTEKIKTRAREAVILRFREQKSLDGETY